MPSRISTRSTPDKVDAGLHDPLLGEEAGGLLETEFRAFVELCYWLGMRVVLDFAFRITARDGVLIADHADWFCWIRKECAPGFRAPSLGDGTTMRGLDDERLGEPYTSPQTAAYLAQFTWSPDRIDPDRWAAVPVGKEVEVVHDAHGPCRRSVSSADNMLLRPCEVAVMETGK